jgi:FeS assembly SUF system protein
MVTKEQVIDVLKQVYDPEIPIDVVDLGLIYNINISEEGDIDILMTLTAVGCPIGSYLVQKVEEELKKIEGVRNVNVELTFDPPWTPERMSEDAKKELGYGDK